MKSKLLGAIALVLIPTFAFTETGSAAGNGAGKSAEITASMLPEVPSVIYPGELVVGVELPGTITYYPVPNYDAYSYAVINNERVLIDPNTHRILRLIP